MRKCRSWQEGRGIALAMRDRGCAGKARGDAANAPLLTKKRNPIDQKVESQSTRLLRSGKASGNHGRASRRFFLAMTRPPKCIASQGRADPVAEPTLAARPCHKGTTAESPSNPVNVFALRCPWSSKLLFSTTWVRAASAAILLI